MCTPASAPSCTNLTASSKRPTGRGMGGAWSTTAGGACTPMRWRAAPSSHPAIHRGCGRRLGLRQTAVHAGWREARQATGYILLGDPSVAGQALCWQGGIHQRRALRRCLGRGGRALRVRSGPGDQQTATPVRARVPAALPQKVGQPGEVGGRKAALGAGRTRRPPGQPKGETQQDQAACDQGGLGTHGHRSSGGASCSTVRAGRDLAPSGSGHRRRRIADNNRTKACNTPKKRQFRFYGIAPGWSGDCVPGVPGTVRGTGGRRSVAVCVW